MADTIQNWLNELDDLLTAGKLAEAERFLLDHLEQLDAEGKSESSEFLALLNELAALYKGCSRFDEAERYLLLVQTVLENNGDTASLPYVTVLINLAGCQRLMGKSFEALALYARLEELLKQLKEDTALGTQERDRLEYLKATTLNNTTLLLCDLEEWDDALDYANQAQELLQQGVGGIHEQATSQNNLAVIYLHQQKYDKAKTAIREALNFYEAMPQENVHHAAALSTYAALCFHEKNFDDAEAALKRALVLTEHFFGKNNEYESTQRYLTHVQLAKGQK